MSARTPWTEKHVRRARASLPCGCEVAHIALGKQSLESLELVYVLSDLGRIYGDRDFANGHALLEKRKEQIKESLAELEDAEEG